ncbi:unnamed protein product [Adineta ricciae]|uniref:Pentapeptide repeat-containing protein n=1 Tax=Adineta ricciae TaxID=249248 RepID=A0A814F4J2_ADIRI|nr:unnamed protein product [Adineta ricciae]
MTVCRQLDVTRKTYLIRFLFEPKAILSHRHVIDLSVSAFSTKQTASLEDISLTGVSLTNASFAVRQFVGANFTESNLQGANFQYASLRNVSFRMAILRNTNFNDTTMSNIDFSAYSTFGAFLPNKTLGLNRNLLQNRNAEKQPKCLAAQIDPIYHSNWNVTPFDGVGITKIDQAVADLAVNRWFRILKQVEMDSEHVHIVGNYFWNSQVNISMTLEEFNSENQTLNIHHFVLPYQGS